MRPWSKKTIRLTTARAKPISCVTHSIVMPGSASFAHHLS